MEKLESEDGQLFVRVSASVLWSALELHKRVLPLPVTDFVANDTFSIRASLASYAHTRKLLQMLCN